jgi:hypothetical protein
MLFALPAAGADPAATPANTEPPLAVPAMLDVVTFNVHTDDEDHKIVVTSMPARLRVDAPSDGFSVIYDPARQFYLGLEHRNYTYWQFSWPGVQAAVEASKRYETRLQDLSTEGYGEYVQPGAASAPAASGPAAGGDNSLGTDTNPGAAAAPSPDVSGYVWTPTNETKRIADLDCVRWTGQSVSGSPVEAWCHAGLIPPVQTAIEQVRAINEPIALVPVRTLFPPFVFEVEHDLTKGGVTPVLITWGDDQDKNRFELISIKTREGRASLFTVPSLYVKTTLVTMDGIGPQKVAKPASQPSDSFPPLPVPAR